MLHLCKGVLLGQPCPEEFIDVLKKKQATSKQHFRIEQLKKEGQSLYTTSCGSGFNKRRMSPRVMFYNSNKSQGTYGESKACEIAQENWRASAEASFWELKQPGLSILL